MKTTSWREKWSKWWLLVWVGILITTYAVVLWFFINRQAFQDWVCMHLFYEKEYNFLRDFTLVMGALITGVFQYFRTQAQNKQAQSATNQIKNQTDELKLKRKSQQDEQFKKAVELLANNDSTFSAKAGAVYILGALGVESPNHAQQCIDMLAELNRWMGERITIQPDFFYRDTAPIWRDRITKYDAESLKAQYNLIEPSWKKKLLDEKQEGKAKQSLEDEELSRLALNKIEAILRHWVAYWEKEEKPDIPNAGLDLSAKFLCQLNLQDLICTKRTVKFVGSILQGANLRLTQFQGADLSGTQLQGADLSGAELQKANLSFAQLQRGDLLYVHLQGANLYETQLQGADLNIAELQGADLRGAQLQGANLSNADLQGAYLSEAELQGANLYETQLQGANLSNADLQGADLSNAQLQGAYLSSTGLQGAMFDNTNLQGIYIDDYYTSLDKSFEERLKPGREGYRLKEEQIRPLSDKDVVNIIEKLKADSLVDDAFIETLTQTLKISVGEANMDGIITGSIPEEDSKRIIKAYRDALAQL